VCATRPGISRAELAAQDRPNSERFEEVRGNNVGQQQRRSSIGTRHQAAAPAKGHHVLERRGALRQRPVLLKGEHVRRVLRRRDKHANQIARMLNPHGMQPMRVHQAENRGARAYAQRQRQHLRQ
jgi:hypothetical protein